MRKATLAAVATGLLAVAGCDNSNQDQLNQVDLNATENLDVLADNAANAASEEDSLQNQQQELNQEQPVAENVAGPETPADENIQGM